MQKINFLWKHLGRVFRTEILFVFFVALCSGCATNVKVGRNLKLYTVPTHVIPGHTEKGEFSLNATFTDYSLSYAFSEHFAAYMAYGFHSFANRETSSWFFTVQEKKVVSNSIGFCHFAMGYYNNTDKAVYHLYGGGGSGKTHYLTDLYKYYESGFGNFTSEYRYTLSTLNKQLFLHPLITFKLNENSPVKPCFTVSSRLVYHHYHNIRITEEDLIQKEQFQGYKTFNNNYMGTFFNTSNKNLFFVEPSLSLRFGSESFRMQIQYITSIGNKNINFSPPSYLSDQKNRGQGVLSNRRIVFEFCWIIFAQKSAWDVR